MKIDNSIKIPPSVSTNTAQPRPASERTASAPQPTPVQLSSVATQLKSDAQPPINRARVQEIKQAIAEGRFKVNADAIADRLISSAKELIVSQRKA